MTTTNKIYLDTPIIQLVERGLIDKTVLKACKAAKPEFKTAADIYNHWKEFGDFHNVPGCRRQSRITELLTFIARTVEPTNMPSELKPVVASRIKAGQLVKDADFDFLNESQRAEVLRFKEENGYLPMIAILRYFLNSEKASRNDVIMSYIFGLNNDGAECKSLADVATRVELSRERVRQIIQTYEIPEQLRHSRLWTNYVDHSTYYADETCPAYRIAKNAEVEGLSFAQYAAVVSRISMLENVDDAFLARKGWTKEIKGWVSRLSRMKDMPRSIENRISIEGLAMGGALDMRLSMVVLHQIAPALGLGTAAPDTIVLPPNVTD